VLEEYRTTWRSLVLQILEIDTYIVEVQATYDRELAPSARPVASPGWGEEVAGPVYARLTTEEPIGAREFLDSAGVRRTS